jgi:hypothetical protein
LGRTEIISHDGRYGLRVDIHPGNNTTSSIGSQKDVVAAAGIVDDGLRDLALNSDWNS